MKTLFTLAFLTLTGLIQAQTFQKKFIAVNGEDIQSVTPTSDNGYIMTATSGSKLLLSKLDPSYGVEWTTAIDTIDATSSYDQTFTVTESVTGGYLLFTTTGAGYGSVMAKFDNTGTPLWKSKQVSSSNAYWVQNSRIEEKPNGNIVLFKSDWYGLCFTEFLPDGTVLWSKTITEDTTGVSKCPGFDFLCMEDSTIIISGKSGDDNCYGRLSASGDLIWNSVFSMGMAYTHARTLAKADDGNFIVGGMRGSNGFLMKMDASNGAIIWNRDVLNISEINDIVALGGDQYLVHGIGVGGVLAVVVVAGNGNELNATQFTDFGALSSYPTFKKVGSTVYLGAKYNDGTKYVYKLVSIDATLSNACTTSPLSDAPVSITNSTSPIASGVLHAIDGENFVLEPIASSSYTLQVIAEDLCAITSVSELESTKIALYPNPTSGILNLSFDNEVGMISITNASGKIMLNQTIHSNTITLDLSGFAKGLYILQHTNENGAVSVQKFMME